MKIALFPVLLIVSFPPSTVVNTLLFVKLVYDLVGERMEVHDFCEVRAAHACDCGAQGLEGGVLWRKDGEIWGS
jgi:hypothetical protein